MSSPTFNLQSADCRVSVVFVFLTLFARLSRTVFSFDRFLNVYNETEFESGFTSDGPNVRYDRRRLSRVSGVRTVRVRSGRRCLRDDLSGGAGKKGADIRPGQNNISRNSPPSVKKRQRAGDGQETNAN